GDLANRLQTAQAVYRADIRDRARIGLLNGVAEIGESGLAAIHGGGGFRPVAAVQAQAWGSAAGRGRWGRGPAGASCRIGIALPDGPARAVEIHLYRIAVAAVAGLPELRASQRVKDGPIRSRGRG